MEGALHFSSRPISITAGRQICAELGFLYSFPNQYSYRDVNYPVPDFFFIARAGHASGASALDGVEGFAWRDPPDVREEEMAFTANWLARQRFLALGRK